MWKKGWTKAPRDENICVVIATSYEVQEQEMQDPEAIEVVLGVENGGELPNDLIFSSTSEGYKIDEESLHSLTSSNSGSHGPNNNTPSRKLTDDFPIEDGELTSTSSEGVVVAMDDNDSGGQQRRNGKKKYATLEMQSPSDQQRSISPVVPPRPPDLNNGSGGRRLGNAVASLVTTARGKGTYSKASNSTSFDEEDDYDTPAAGKTID